MSYRGHDLDLRSPGGRSTASVYVGAAAQPVGRHEPLWVDDIVLATCNHAYDIALAHRSAEVRIEHVLNAATRIDAATRVFEANGYNIAALRRATSDQIVAAAPVPMLSARYSPKTSAEVEETLQLAVRRAALRKTPATIHDILTVLIDMKREIPGFETARPASEHWSLRDATAPRYVPDYRYVAAPEPVREWVREPAPEAYMPVTDSIQNTRLDGIERMVRDLAQTVGGELQRREAPREWVRGSTPGYYVSPPPRPEPYSPATDSIQNARLDGLERMLRDMIGDLQRRETPRMPEPVVVAPRIAETPSYGPATLERLGVVERNVDAKFAELARTWSLLGERLGAIEQALAKPRVDMANALPAGLADRLRGLEGLDQKFVELDRTITVMADRMVALERHMTNRPVVANGSVDISPLMDLVADLERKVTSGPRGTAIDMTPLMERIAGIERSLATRPVGANVDLKPLFDRLDGLDRKIGGMSFEGGGDIGAMTEHIGERLKEIEDGVAAQRSGFAHFAASIGNEVRQIAASARQSPANPEQMRSVIGEQMQTFATLIERQPTQLASSIAQPLMQRITQIGSQVEARQADSDRAFGAIAERLGVLERTLTGWSQQAAEAGVTHERDIREVHDALVRLNTNQQTLASSMDQWRLDLTGDLGELANRISLIEAQSQKPMAVLERMATSMDTIQASAFKRDEQKSRFRQWLMGTDDWYGASWDANGTAVNHVDRQPVRPTDATRGVRPPPVPTMKRDA
jgi:hypothetical protein